MSAASTDRLLSQRRARKRKARWPRKLKNLREQTAAAVRSAEEWARAAIESTEGERQALRARVETLERHGPAVVEVVDVKTRGFFGRLRWALRFAWSRTLEFERLASR